MQQEVYYVDGQIDLVIVNLGLVNVKETKIVVSIFLVVLGYKGHKVVEEGNQKGNRVIVLNGKRVCSYCKGQDLVSL